LTDTKTKQQTMHMLGSAERLKHEWMATEYVCWWCEFEKSRLFPK